MKVMMYVFARNYFTQVFSPKMTAFLADSFTKAWWPSAGPWQPEIVMLNFVLAGYVDWSTYSSNQATESHIFVAGSLP